MHRFHVTWPTGGRGQRALAMPFERRDLGRLTWAYIRATGRRFSATTWFPTPAILPPRYRLLAKDIGSWYSLCFSEQVPRGFLFLDCAYIRVAYHGTFSLQVATPLDGI